MNVADRFEVAGDRSELTLELARRSHEPAAADRARNLAALRSRLGLPAPPQPVPQQAPAPAAAPRLPALAPWQQLLGVGVLTGAIGFFLGLGVSERTRQTTENTAPLRAPAAPHAELAPVLTEPVTAAAAAPFAAAPSAAPSSTTEPRNAPPRSAAPARAVKARRVAPSVSAPERSDPSLLEAVRLLARARRALERQEPALALGLLDELDARFARELLDEERAATRVLALCASGEQGRARELARGWLVERPRSIYTRRLEQSCAGAALRSGAPEK